MGPYCCDGRAGALCGVASGEVLGRLFGGGGGVEDCGGGRGGESLDDEGGGEGEGGRDGRRGGVGGGGWIWYEALRNGGGYPGGAVV